MSTVAKLSTQGDRNSKDAVAERLDAPRLLLIAPRLDST